MKNSRPILSALALLAVGNHSIAQTTLFNQNFDSSTTLSTYVGIGANQFDAITAGTNTSISVSSNALSFDHTGIGTSFFARSTDLSPTPSAVKFQFDVNVSGNSVAQTTSAVSPGVSIYLGSGLTTGATAENGANMAARINIGWTTTAGEWNLLRGGLSGASANQTGTQTISWFVNNGAGSLTYAAPDSGNYSLANNTYDLWIGNTRVFSATSITTTGLAMTDFKFRYDTNAANALVSFDNITLSSLAAIPEPSTYAAIAGGLAFAGAVWRRRNKK